MVADLGTDPFDSKITAFDSEFARQTAELRAAGRGLRPGLLTRAEYIEKNATRSILFLIDMHKWKSTYVGKFGDFLQLDDPEKVAGIFYDFFHADSEAERIRLLCSITLLGCGADPAAMNFCRRKAAMMAEFLNPWDVTC